MHRTALLSRHSRAGFTLVEMMVTVAVLVVLLGLAVPSFQDLLARQRLKGAAAELVAHLEAAKGESLVRSQPVRMTFYASAGCYVYYTVGNIGECTCTTCDLGVRRLATVYVDTARDLALSTGPRDHVLLNGGIPGQVTGMTLSHSRVGRIVTRINEAGLVSSCSEDGISGVPAC